MNTFKAIRAIVALIVILVVAVSLAFAQGDGTSAPAPDLPLILLVPYFLGVFLHWLKKYSLEGMQVNFLVWIFKDLQGTILSSVIGLGALWSSYLMNPAMYGTVNFGTWITVIIAGIGADTFNSITANKAKST